MKKMIAIALALLLLTAAAHAAQWPAGRSAAQPYAGVPEIDLSTSMGYVMRYPQQKLPAQKYCDVLEIYLPREDVALGQGTLTLKDERGEEVAIRFDDPEAVSLRPLEEPELRDLMWGGGVCIQARLPFSLRFDGEYTVRMDAGCYTAADGAVSSLALTGSEWDPMVEGDYGISGLRYSEPAAADSDVPGYVAVPRRGDAIRFDVVLGGEAKVAVIYSENDSVLFDVPEFSASGRAAGTVASDDVRWGVVFLDASGEVLDMIELGG